jgi:hypothetical protein
MRLPLVKNQNPAYLESPETELQECENPSRGTKGHIPTIPGISQEIHRMLAHTVLLYLKPGSSRLLSWKLFSTII